MYQEKEFIWQLTIEEFKTLMEEIAKPNEENLRKAEEKYVYGIRGLAKLLGCSPSTAQKIKNSGKINKATIPVGRSLAFETDKVMDLLKLKKNR